MKLYWGIFHFRILSDLCHKLEDFNSEDLDRTAEQVERVVQYAPDEIKWDCFRCVHSGSNT